MPFKDPEKARAYSRDRNRRERAKDPAANNTSARRYYTLHREKIRANYSPAKHRDWWLKRNYGITTAEWNALFVSQGSCCALCSASEPGSAKGWHTDHDHETKKVRGILCKGCNTSLGTLGDTKAKIIARSARILEYVS